MQTTSIASLRAIAGTSHQELCTVSGYYHPMDGGGGSFRWDSLATEPDNGGTIIAVNGIPAGRWKRILNTGYINVKWFGASGISGDSAAVQQEKLRPAGPVLRHQGFQLKERGYLL